MVYDSRFSDPDLWTLLDPAKIHNQNFIFLSLKLYLWAAVKNFWPILLKILKRDSEFKTFVSGFQWSHSKHRNRIKYLNKTPICSTIGDGLQSDIQEPQIDVNH